MPSGPLREAFFAGFGTAASDARFCLWHAPENVAPHAVVVQVHAFAEEMNKCRRMAALGARALAMRGVAVLQFDLLGCGDSGGEFEDATWAAWISDVVGAVDLARRRAGSTRSDPLPLWLWGSRAGCLLAAAALPRLPAPVHLLCWQPVVNGRQALQQFLRLKTAGALGDRDPKATLEQARADLAAGRPVDVAGYRLPPDVASGLEQARFEPPAGRPGRLEWLEVDSRPQPELLPASRSAAASWESAGWSVDAAAVAGPPFWSTVEIEEAPRLIEASIERLGVSESA